MQTQIDYKTAGLCNFASSKNGPAPDILFYTQIITPGSSVLEAGCSTGDIARELANQGSSVTGVDLSEPVLEMFRSMAESLPHASEDIASFQMNITSFALGQSFDWIIFPRRIFQTLITGPKRKECLWTAKKHMKKDSRMVLTLANPAESISQDWGETIAPAMDIAAKGTPLRVRRRLLETTHSAVEQTVVLNLCYEFYEEGKCIGKIQDRLSLCYLYPDQCIRLFKDAGFSIVDAYGDYDCRPLTPEEKNEQIYILKPAQ